MASSNWSPSKGSSTGTSSGSSTASSSSRRKRAAEEGLALHFCSRLLHLLLLLILLRARVLLEVALYLQNLYHHPESHLQPALCCHCQCQSYHSWWLSCRISLSCALGQCWRAHPLTSPLTPGAWSQPQCLMCESCHGSLWTGATDGYPSCCHRCSHCHVSSYHMGPGPCLVCHWYRTPGSASSLRKKDKRNK